MEAVATEANIQMEQALENIQKLTDNIETVIRGKRTQIQFILTALIFLKKILMMCSTCCI